MGLLLLIPGLVMAWNGTTWFPGEDGVGTALIWIGAVILALQFAIMAIVAWAAARR